MRYILLCLTLIICIAFCAEPFIGIGTSNNDDPPGIEVTQVVRNSPAKISGIEVGDVITHIDGIAIPNRDSLNVFLDSCSAGDLVKITIDRCGRAEKFPLILANRDFFQGSMKEGDRESFPTDSAFVIPEWRNDSTTAMVLSALEENGLLDEYDSLAIAFRTELDEYHGYYTLDAVALPLLQPAATYFSAERVLSDLSARGGDPINIWAGVPFALDVDTTHGLIRPQPGTIEGIIECVRRANAQIDSAFMELSEEELNDVADIGPYLLDILEATVYIDNDPDEGLVDEYIDMIAASKKVDYHNLITSGQLLSGLYQPGRLLELADIQPGDGSNPERDILIDKQVIVASKDSAGKSFPVYGRMIVTGTGNGVYDEQAAIWIDLGGNDTYRGFCGGTPYVITGGNEHIFKQGRVGVHIDLGGNDTYIRNTPGAIGSGYCGGGCLIDLKDNDKYYGDKLCQSAAFFGTGMLIDTHGEDNYLAQENSQGFAVFGTALLYDATGNDNYTGTRYVQGVGMPKGLGMMIDHSGDDSYTASYKIPNGYGNEDTWDGWSQGVGMGFRNLAAGGIGLLIDRSGDDNYLAGNFSQACGYFFGFGILDDGEGDDIFKGNRYVQGSGAHQALGYFRNRAGNDVYIGHEATNQAGTWDITTAYFIDDSGNDSYSGSGLSLGGAAQNAFAVFIDRDGEDIYNVSSSRSVGMSGGNDYHPEYNAKSLGIFFDLGDDKDDYSDVKDKRKNGKVYLTDDDDNENTGDGLFIDE